MDSEKLLGLMLDVGVLMIRSGGETHRVVDTLYRMAGSFGFGEINFWVVPSNIQATVTDPEGKRHTQIRNIRGAGIDYDRLAKLNALSRWTCAEQPDAAALESRLREIENTPPQKRWIVLLGCALAGWGFSLFFGCTLVDSAVALIASLIAALLIRLLSAHEGNPLILNFIVSFVAEFVIILAVHFGFGAHMGLITIGVVMLVISGLGTTNGLRDLVHLDTLSGVMNITAAFIGAIGISLGIALPLFILKSWVVQSAAESASVANQLIFGTVACVGFALWFRVRGWKVFFCAIGAFCTTGIYILIFRLLPDLFIATLAASVFCAAYAQIMARVNKTPATIFSTVCILTLLPGSSLYYLMHGIVTKNAPFAKAHASDLFLVCFGIVLGYMIVEVVSRFFRKPVHHR